MQHSTEPRDGNMSELSRNHLLIEPTSSEHPGSKNMKKLKVLRRVWNSWNIWTFRRVWTFRGPEPSEGLSLQHVFTHNSASSFKHTHTHTHNCTHRSVWSTYWRQRRRKKEEEVGGGGFSGGGEGWRGGGEPAASPSSSSSSLCLRVLCALKSACRLHSSCLSVIRLPVSEHWVHLWFHWCSFPLTAAWAGC